MEITPKKAEGVMQMTERIYGADFSGARDASKGIYYAGGLLEGNEFTLLEMKHCDDRLDLFAKMISLNGNWGLDFPFSYSVSALKTLGLTNAAELHQLVAAMSREQFAKFIEAKGLPRSERPCTKAGIDCRWTDVASFSQSPLKAVNPNLRSMCYSGFKMLAYLREAGVRIYPFDHFSVSNSASVFEVYPSHLWRNTLGKRSLNLNQLIEVLHEKCLLRVKLAHGFSIPDSQDAADAIVAAITLALVIHQDTVQGIWERCPTYNFESEWTHREVEGLIVRGL